MISFFLFFLLLLLQLSNACTYTPHEWSLRASSSGANSYFCNVTWNQLLSVDLANLIVPQNQLWIAATQQYIGALLNRGEFPQNSSEMSPDVTQAMLLLGFSLEFQCNNISQWVMGLKENNAMARLFQFNYGLLSFAQACKVNSSDTGDKTFYYYNSVDTFVVLDRETNQTITLSECNSQKNTILWLSVGVTVLLFMLLMCFFNRAVSKSNEIRIRMGSIVEQHHLQEEEKATTNNPFHHLSTSSTHDDDGNIELSEITLNVK